MENTSSSKTSLQLEKETRRKLKVISAFDNQSMKATLESLVDKAYRDVLETV